MSIAQLEDRCLSEAVSDYSNPFINSVKDNGETKEKPRSRDTIIDDEDEDEEISDLEDEEMLAVDPDYFNEDEY